MDMSMFSTLSGLSSTTGANSVQKMPYLTGALTEKTDTVDGNMFSSILGTAIDNIKATNSYLSDAENEEIRFALGETDNTHDLSIALEKASTALQYTVAIRDRLMDAYKELMQIQI